MIVKKSKRLIAFLKTTAIGGLLFLLPLIVLGALVGQIAPIVVAVSSFLNKYVPVKTASGVALLVGLSIAIILLLCFAAGVFARWSLGRKISIAFEAFGTARYSVLKDQMADTIGGDETKPQMKPVLVPSMNITVSPSRQNVMKNKAWPRSTCPVRLIHGRAK